MLMMGNKEKKISFRLDTDLVNGLQSFADRERVPLSYVLRHLVIRFLSPSSTAPGLCLGAVPIARKKPALEPSKTRCDAISEKAERDRVDFRNRVFAHFDGFRGQGFDMKEAAKRANSALKAEGHCWATYEVVADVLRKSGRFRKAKGARS